MQTVDKQIASFSVFNQREDQMTESAQFDRSRGLETFAPDYSDLDAVGDKYANISSVQQLKHLLKNYDALVEG